MAKFLNGPTDVEWLKETHLASANVGLFKSFILHGNEDYPLVLELFRQAEPSIADQPMSRWVPDEIEGWKMPQRRYDEYC